jgi:hypothetical protein
MTEERPMFECDAEVYTCPYCCKDVVAYWALNNSGLISQDNYVPIANWIYHSECWNKQMKEHPPGENIVEWPDDTF